MSDEPDPLYSPLDALVKAASPAELVQAHRAVSKALIAKRRKLAKSQGALARTFVAAMEQWDAEKAAGVSEADRVAHLQVILRAAWPFTRTWQYLCQRCDDTGLVMAVCRKGARCNGISTRIDHHTQQPGKYKRLCAQFPDSDYEHEYGTPCFCEKGARFRPPSLPARSDYTQSGKSKPMTKVGRR
jgi:hypothetical protein